MPGASTKNTTPPAATIPMTYSCAASGSAHRSANRAPAAVCNHAYVQAHAPAAGSSAAGMTRPRGRQVLHQ